MPSRSLIAILVSLLAACAGSSPIMRPAPSSTTTGSVTHSRSPESWTFTRDGTSRAYVSTTTATFEQQTSPLQPPRSISAITDFTIAFHGDDFSRFQITVEKLSYSGDERSDRNSGEFVVPLLFTGSHHNGKTVFDSMSLSALIGCTNPAYTTFFTIHRNLFALPAVVVQGTIWADSMTLSGCSGSLPVQLTVARTYRVAGQAEHDGKPVLVIEQAGHLVAIGEGAEGQHRVFLRSRGTESGRFYLEPVSGFLLEAEIKQSSTVTVTTSGRSQDFVQSVHERVQRR